MQEEKKQVVKIVSYWNQPRFLKDGCLFLGKKAMTNLDSVLKSRDITFFFFLKKGSYSQSYGFSSNHVQMWELDCKEGWVLKYWYFWMLVVLEKTLESLGHKEIKSVNSKEINPEFSLEGLMLKLQYFGHLMWKADSLEKTLMLGKTEGKRRSGWQRVRWHHRLNGHEFEQTLGDGEEQGSLMCCSFVGSQGIGHNLATEEQNFFKKRPHQGEVAWPFMLSYGQYNFY